ncbi:MAG: hypothetical protein ACOYZ8_06640 [Chloroflexota bacterium]
MARLQDQFVAGLASEAMEILEDYMLFPGGYPLPLSARGSGEPGSADRPLPAEVAFLTVLNCRVCVLATVQALSAICRSFH